MTKIKDIERKINQFVDTVEKMMVIIIKIPELVDNNIKLLNLRLNTLETKIMQLTTQIYNIKRDFSSLAPVSIPTPPPPPSAPPSPLLMKPKIPTDPTSIRGALMGELKELFNNRENNKKQFSEV